MRFFDLSLIYDLGTFTPSINASESDLHGSQNRRVSFHFAFRVYKFDLELYRSFGKILIRIVTFGCAVYLVTVYFVKSVSLNFHNDSAYLVVVSRIGIWLVYCSLLLYTIHSVLLNFE